MNYGAFLISIKTCHVVYADAHSTHSHSSIIMLIICLFCTASYNSFYKIATVVLWDLESHLYGGILSAEISRLLSKREIFFGVL